jgi:hypothetical protein
MFLERIGTLSFAARLLREESATIAPLFPLPRKKWERGREVPLPLFLWERTSAAISRAKERVAGRAKERVAGAPAFLPICGVSARYTRVQCLSSEKSGRGRPPPLQKIPERKKKEYSGFPQWHRPPGRCAAQPTRARFRCRRARSPAGGNRRSRPTDAIARPVCAPRRNPSRVESPAIRADGSRRRHRRREKC